MILIGKIVGLNSSDNMINLAVQDKDNNLFNIKAEEYLKDTLIINEVFQFDLDVKVGDRTQYFIKGFKNVRDFDYEEKDENLRNFYNHSPISREESEKEINKYINLIENKILKDITNEIVNKFHDSFFLYPAATRMHHAYVGGLAYHTIGMLHLADSFMENYPFLKADYLYSGIILHDICKTEELTDMVFPSYSTEGQLLGHLVMASMEVAKAAEHLGYEKTEEVMVLEHILISHHGIPQYGACKKPMIAEALLIWFIDSIDSKFRVLEEELPKVQSEEFTSPIGVLEKMKIYKI